MISFHMLSNMALIAEIFKLRYKGYDGGLLKVKTREKFP